MVRMYVPTARVGNEIKALYCVPPPLPPPPKQHIIYVGHLVFLARNILNAFYNLYRTLRSRGGIIISHVLETHHFTE